MWMPFRCVALQGTHDELLAKEGVYYQLWNTQQKEGAHINGNGNGNKTNGNGQKSLDSC